MNMRRRPRLESSLRYVCLRYWFRLCAHPSWWLTESSARENKGVYTLSTTVALSNVCNVVMLSAPRLEKTVHVNDLKQRIDEGDEDEEED